MPLRTVIADIANRRASTQVARVLVFGLGSTVLVSCADVDPLRSRATRADVDQRESPPSEDIDASSSGVPPPHAIEAGSGVDAHGDADGPSDVTRPTPEQPPVARRCDPSAPFGKPTRLEEFKEILGGDPWLDADARTLLFSRDAPGGRSRFMFAERAERDAPFGGAAEVPLDTWKGDEFRAALSPDGKRIYFARRGRIFRARRPGAGEPFAGDEALPIAPPLADPVVLDAPRPAGEDIYYVASERNRRWGVFRFNARTRVSTPIVSDTERIGGLAITPDEKVLYVAFDRAEGWSVHRAQRAARDAPFPTPSRVAELSLPRGESRGFSVTGVSGDDCEVVGYTLSSRGETSLFHAMRRR
jgi:hypothetical protein